VTHGLHLLRRSAGVQARLACRALRTLTAAVDRVVCVSDAERRDLAAVLDDRLLAKVVVVRNGVPLPDGDTGPARTAARAELGLADDAVVALYAGQLEARKDPLAAARAAREVNGRGLPLVLVVVGDGPLRDELRRLEGPGVRVLGRRSDLDRLLAAADIFVLPSEREGMSFALLEAMAHGLAPVVSDGPGNPETVGVAGRVVPVGDDAALAAALEELTSDADQRSALGAAARDRVAQVLTADALVAGFRAVLDEVAD
jgi:glycosyltransferase involved in cell wall biosynthesis